MMVGALSLVGGMMAIDYSYSYYSLTSEDDPFLASKEIAEFHWRKLGEGGNKQQKEEW